MSVLSLTFFENVTVTANKLLPPVHGGVGAFPLAAGVTVEDERPLEDRLQHPGQGVMHDTIPERGGADLPGLALVNRERAVGTETVGLAGKFLVQQEQVAFEIEDEAGNAGLEAFATGGGMSRKKHALERVHPVP